MRLGQGESIVFRHSFSLLANMQIAKGKKITVEDLMKHIYPPTELDRMKEEIEFKREWIESGGGEIE